MVWINISFLNDLDVRPAVDSYQLQTSLDGVDGQPFYFDLVTAAAQQFEQLEVDIDAGTSLVGVACFSDRTKHVVYGGTNKDDVGRMRGLVAKAAEHASVHFSDRTSQPRTPAVRIGECVFSAAGIIRDTSAA